MTVGGKVVNDHPVMDRVSRDEQAGNWVTITVDGIIHDMRCDGTREHGVHDVAAADFSTPVHVVATYEHGLHVLRPNGVEMK